MIIPFKALYLAFVRANLHYRNDRKDYDKLTITRNDGTRMGQVEYRKDGYNLVRIDDAFIRAVGPHFDEAYATQAINRPQEEEQGKGNQTKGDGKGGGKGGRGKGKGKGQLPIMTVTTFPTNTTGFLE